MSQTAEQFLDARHGFDARSGQLQGFSYKLTQGQYGLDVALPEFSADSVDEGRMSAWIVFADGTNRDGVGDKLEVGGIRTERHQKNPIVLFDHGQKVQLPVALAEDPETHDYTVVLDPVNQVAKGNAFFYQGKGLSGVDRTDEYDHAVFCEQLFHMIAKRFVRAGSFGYQVLRGEQIPADYRAGIPQGLHLLSTLLLEFSPVVLPANADTVRKLLSDDRMCGKRLSPYLVKSLAPYAPERKAFMAVETKARPKKPSDKLRDQDQPNVLGYDLDRESLTPIHRPINVNAPGDYGADPLGNGKFRMVPSGDIVDFEERNRRLDKKKSYANDPLDARDDYDNPLSDATVPPAAFRPGKGAIKELRKKYGRKSQIPGDLDWLKEEGDESEHKSLSDDVRRIMRGHDVTVEPWGGGTAVIRWNDPSQEKLALRRLEEYGYYSVNGPDPDSIKVTGGGNVRRGKSLISKPTEIPGVGRVMIHWDTGTRELQIDTDDENRAYVGDVSGGKVRWRKNPYGYETDASITDHVNRWLSVNGKGFRSGSPRNYNRNYYPSTGGSGFADNANLDQQFIEQAKDALDRQGYVGKTAAGRQAAVNWLEGEVAKGNLRKVVLSSFFSGVTQNVYLNNKGRLHQLDKIVQEGWKSLPGQRSKGFVEAVLAALGIAGAVAAHRMIANGADKLARWFEGQESSGATPQQVAQKVNQTPAIRSALDEYIAAIEGGSRKSLAAEQKSLRNVAAKNGLYVSAFADPASLVNDYAAFASDLVNRFGGAAGASAEIDRLRSAATSGDLMTRRVLDKLRLAVAKIGQMGKAMKNLRGKYGSKAYMPPNPPTVVHKDDGWYVVWNVRQGKPKQMGPFISEEYARRAASQIASESKSLEMRQKYGSKAWNHVQGQGWQEVDVVKQNRNGTVDVRDKKTGEVYSVYPNQLRNAKPSRHDHPPLPHESGINFDKTAKSLEMRQKYRPVKKLRRRLRKSSPGASTMWIDGKDLDALRKESSEKGLEAAWVGHKNGMDKVRLSGDDAAIDAVAKKFGRTGGWKGLSGIRVKAASTRTGQYVQSIMEGMGVDYTLQEVNGGVDVRSPDRVALAAAGSQIESTGNWDVSVISGRLEVRAKSLRNQGRKAFAPGQVVRFSRSFLGYPARTKVTFVRMLPDDPGMAEVKLSNGHQYAVIEDVLEEIPRDGKSLPNQGRKAGLTAGSRFQFDYQNWVVTEIDQRTGQLTARGDDGDELQFDVDDKGKPVAYAKSLPNARRKAVRGDRSQVIRVDRLKDGDMVEDGLTVKETRNIGQGGIYVIKYDDGSSERRMGNEPIRILKSLPNARRKAVLGTKPTQNEVQMRVDALRNGGMEAQDAINAAMAELGLVNLKLSPGGDVIAYEHLGGTSVKAFQIGDRVFVVEGSSKIEGVIDNRARDSRGMVYSVILSSGGSYTARENELVSAAGKSIRTGKKAMSFRQVLDNPEGRRLIETAEEYVSDLRRTPGRSEHIQGLREIAKELQRKFGFKYDISEQEQAYRAAGGKKGVSSVGGPLPPSGGPKPAAGGVRADVNRRREIREYEAQQPKPKTKSLPAMTEAQLVEAFKEQQKAMRLLNEGVTGAMLHVMDL